MKNFENLFYLLKKLKKIKNNFIVVSCDSCHIEDKNSINSISKNLALLKDLGINVILVHSGGPEISSILSSLNVKVNNSFTNVSSVKEFALVEMILRGSINPYISSLISLHGGDPISISGKDGNFIKGSSLKKIVKGFENSNIDHIVDNSFIGKPEKININFIEDLSVNQNLIPIVSPVILSSSSSEKSYFIDPVSLASFVSHSLCAEKLIILSDFDNIDVIDGKLKTKKLNTVLSSDLLFLIKENKINDFDLKKKSIIESCIDAVDNNVKSAIICNGLTEDALLMSVLRDNDDESNESSFGTMITS